MRKIGLVAAAQLSILSGLALSASADDAAKVYYKEGTRIETADFDMRINLQIQPRFTYEDLDQGGREDIGAEDVEDTTSFDLRRVRAEFSGNLLNKKFSYKVQDDFRSDGGGSELKDAWLQWNSEQANIRWGQFKVPFSRQENVSSTKLSFIDRSIANEIFAPSRHMGAMIHGALTESSNYYLGTFNGESIGEGINSGGVDNKLAVDAAVTANLGDYGSRGVEGDHRADKSSTAGTVGAAFIYGEGTGEESDLLPTGDFERFDLNVDGGLRSNGLDIQTEFYYSLIQSDQDDLDSEDLDLFGFYVQGGYMIGDEWEAGLRYAYVAPDEDFSAIDDVQEYSFVLNYFINGHNLKLQTGVTCEVTSFSDGDDLTDFRFETQLAAYL